MTANFTYLAGDVGMRYDVANGAFQGQDRDGKTVGVCMSKCSDRSKEKCPQPSTPERAHMKLKVAASSSSRKRKQEKPRVVEYKDGDVERCVTR